MGERKTENLAVLLIQSALKSVCVCVCVCVRVCCVYVCVCTVYA